MMILLTGIDVTTGMSMAVQVPDKSPSQFSIECVKSFLLEIGRTEGILQSDKEPGIRMLLSKVASDMGSIQVRTSPAYSSGSLGSLERFHGTLQAQMRTLILQIQIKAGLTITTDHPLMPWLVRHSAWLVSRYLVHSADRRTSYFRRWEREYNSHVCQFGEAIHFKRNQPAHMVQKLELHWNPGIWLGRCTGSNEHIVGTSSRVYKTRSVRRMPESRHWQTELLQSVKGTPSAPRGDGREDPSFLKVPLTPQVETPTPPEQEAEPTDLQPESSSMEVGESSKRRLEEDSSASSKRNRVATISLRGLSPIQVHVNEEITLDSTDEIHGNDVFTQEELKKAKETEMSSMQDFKVFEQVHRDSLTADQQKALITSRWVHRRKGDNLVRSRLVCRGFNEQIADKDDIYAGTPMLSSFRCLLTLSMSRGWEMYTGDVSTAFLHADVRDDGIHVEPPTGEDTDSEGRRVVWRLRKAMYGLRSAPKSWQDHFAGVVMSIGMRRMKSDSSVFVSKNCILMAYVDDIFISAESFVVVQEVVQKLRVQLLLKDTGLPKARIFNQIHWPRTEAPRRLHIHHWNDGVCAPSA